MEPRVIPLTLDEKAQLLSVLFPWGFATVNQTRFIGPSPGKSCYNILALELDEGYFSDDSVFALKLEKVDDDIEIEDLRGFYMGYLKHAFPDYVCGDNAFLHPDDFLEFSRR